MQTRGKAFCFGEILFDQFPDGDHLGGAPLNVAWYLRQLGVPVAMISAVGRDAFGRSALAALRRAGIDTALVAEREEPTGTVGVSLRDGQPEYEIRESVAWDHIRIPEHTVTGGSLLCYGSIAQRTPENRATLAALFAAGFEHRLFDINLRKGCSDEVVLASLSKATMVKMNEDEWGTLQRMTGAADAEDFRRRYGLRALVVTRGKAGALLCIPSGCHEYPVKPVNVVDAVGAGDAVSAVLGAALIRSIPLELAMPMACQVGSYVVQHRGAQVKLPAELVSAMAGLAPDGMDKSTRFYHSERSP